jgi:hypothetical protein
VNEPVGNALIEDVRAAGTASALTRTGFNAILDGRAMSRAELIDATGAAAADVQRLIGRALIIDADDRVPMIELLQVPGCPNVAGARQTLESCLQQLGLDVPIVERVGDFASPSILVDGVDVMGKHELSGAACRLDLPTEDRILAALRDTAHPTRSP